MAATGTPAPALTSLGKGPKPKDPEPWSGNVAKLRQFLVSLETVFALRPRDFQEDRNKVLYAATFLQKEANTW